jgi:polar amino acid transport system substrate-binding protein
VGSQQSFPPVEFLESSSRGDPSGVSVDLLQEIGRRLGRRIQFVHADYSALIPGLRAGRFDMVSGGMSDTPEREEQVDFVNYLMSGGSILARQSDRSKYSTIDDFCGRKLATLLGSRVIMEGVEAASARCVQRKLEPIDVAMFPSATDARTQLDVGRVDGYLGDLPALIYMVQTSPADYHIVGGRYVLVPYVISWGFPKGSALTHQIRDAAQGMLEDGTYRSILSKWGLPESALPAITINSPASKRDVQ